MSYKSPYVMHKRHQVMDLFHGHQTEAFGEWHDFHNQKPDRHDKIRMLLVDNSEEDAYFYDDKYAGHYLWHVRSKNYIADEDVKGWKYMREKSE